MAGGLTSGKWLVNLTGEVPTRPGNTPGKPKYKPTVKAAVMREEWELREQEATSIPATLLR